MVVEYFNSKNYVGHYVTKSVWKLGITVWLTSCFRYWFGFDQYL